MIAYIYTQIKIQKKVTKEEASLQGHTSYDDGKKNMYKK